VQLVPRGDLDQRDLQGQQARLAIAEYRVDPVQLEVQAPRAQMDQLDQQEAVASLGSLAPQEELVFRVKQVSLD